MDKMFFSRLNFKLIAIILLVLVPILILLSIFTTANLQSDLIATCARNTYNTSEIIKNSTRYSMVLNLKGDVNEILHNIGKNKDIDVVKIYDKKGVIRYASDSSYLYQSVGINSRTCSPCHDHTIPLEKLSVEDRTMIVDSADIRDLVILNPIENDPDCYNAACHAHDKDATILGILEMRVPLEKIDAIVDHNVANVLTNSLIGTILSGILIIVLITIMVNKPLKKISHGINEIGKGNLSYKITVDTQDELGDVATQLNEMSDKLLDANKEINEWNVKLNKKVKEKSEELKVLYNQVIQVERLASLGKLSATVAHELNNPLAGILNFAKLIIRKLKKLQTEDEYEKILEHLQLIAEESDRCGKIVKDLLLFSHRGDEEFTIESTTAIMNKAATLMNHHLEINKITLEKEYQNKDVYIKCNPQKIQQALMSLMMNAVDAMNENGKITLRLSIEDQKVVIRVADTGTGINPQDIDHIFEPFYTTKDTGKGTGLGLSVVYGIVQNHNGSINVEKTNTEGTTFKMSFPLIEGNAYT